MPNFSSVFVVASAFKSFFSSMNKIGITAVTSTNTAAMYSNVSFPKTIERKYANTPKKPDTICIHTKPAVRTLPSGVRSAIMERAGLKVTFTAKSRKRAMSDAMIIISPMPVIFEISCM